MSLLQDSWYHRSWLTWLLLPFEGLFLLLIALRRLLYRMGILRSQRMPVPVIIVGNISVGGTGKTPMVIAVVEQLRQMGWRPGVISRGYGGMADEWPQPVTPDSDPQLVGDEPLLIARRSGAPMMVGPDRSAAARQLLSTEDVNVIVSDDGLQHYRLQRDVEIVVVDGARGLGNGHCLPAGPLREPHQRMQQVDMVVVNGGGGEGITMQLQPQAARNLSDDQCVRNLESFHGERVHAVAGIGNPQRFFRMLESFDLDIVPHPFPDHHHFEPADLDFGDTAPVLMTEKDAVKCHAFGDKRFWYIPVTARLPDSFGVQLNNLLER